MPPLTSYSNFANVFNLHKCGEIREMKLKTIGTQGIAMLEFMDRNSVLAAQTKDKKRINGVEVEVTIAWKSCLFVTNYPDEIGRAHV